MTLVIFYLKRRALLRRQPAFDFALIRGIRYQSGQVHISGVGTIDRAINSPESAVVATEPDSDNVTFFHPEGIQQFDIFTRKYGLRVDGRFARNIGQVQFERHRAEAESNSDIASLECGDELW